MNGFDGSHGFWPGVKRGAQICQRSGVFWGELDWLQQDQPDSAIMSISKIRGLLYFVARLLGDVTAVKKGAIGKRVLRRAAGKVTGRFLGKLIK